MPFMYSILAFMNSFLHDVGMPIWTGAITDTFFGSHAQQIPYHSFPPYLSPSPSLPPSLFPSPSSFPPPSLPPSSAMDDSRYDREQMKAYNCKIVNVQFLNRCAIY